MSNTGKTIRTVSCGTCLFRKIDDEYEVLLVRPHAHRDAWGVPKGHIDEGESEEECAVRETVEETGLTPILTDKKLADVKVKHAYEHKTVKVWMAQVDASAEFEQPDGENFDIKWHRIDHLPQLHKYQISLLEEAVLFLKGR